MTCTWRTSVAGQGHKADKPVKPNERIVTRGDVARIFCVSPHTVSRWSREGKLPSVRTLGGQRRYVLGKILRLAANAGIPNDGTPEHSR